MRKIKVMFFSCFQYDVSKDNFIDLMELKLMMEKLGAPQVPLLHVLGGSLSFTLARLGRSQTHIGLKAMIAEIDEDSDGQISFREFLLIFRKVCSP